MSIDYKTLLEKYIAHVGECEGVTFLRDHDRNDFGISEEDRFTDEEWVELQRLDEINLAKCRAAIEAYNESRRPKVQDYLFVSLNYRLEDEKPVYMVHRMAAHEDGIGLYAQRNPNVIVMAID